MKKTIYLTILFSICFTLAVFPSDNCKEDIKDPRGAMKPWGKGAWETGKYRNLFLEAGYKQEEIDAKLQKAYHDLFEGLAQNKRLPFHFDLEWETLNVQKTHHEVLGHCHGLS